MAEITWYYLRNTFDSVTKGSFKRMLVLATDHHEKLLAESANDAQINSLYQLFEPVYLAFKDAYNNTFKKGAIYQGNTQIVETMFAELSSKKVRQWDIWIQNVYLDNEPEYLMLLPNGRSPFQTGGYEARINAIVALEGNLGNFPALANVLSDVSAFRQQLEHARATQQNIEKSVANATKAVEDARFELAKVMHAVLGGLILRYYENLSQVETFYELKYLRASSGSSGSNTATVPMQSHSIGASQRATLYGQLTNENEITIENTGSVAITCFTSNNVNAAVPLDPLILQAGESQTLFADELSDGNGYSWLIIINQDSSIIASCKVGKG